jgi:dTDP-D-glucose 4,6-dehydratase
LSEIAKHLGVMPPARHIPYRLAVALGATAESVYHLAKRASAPPLMRYGVQLWGGDNRFIIRRAREELGFAPQVNMREGVARTIAWYRSLRQSSTSRREESRHAERPQEEVACAS